MVFKSKGGVILGPLLWLITWRAWRYQRE